MSTTASTDLGVYAQGAAVTFSAEYIDAGSFFDPVTIVFVTKHREGRTTYTWPTPLTITRDSLGKFHRTVTLSIPGDWFIEWQSTRVTADGTVPGVGIGHLTVLATKV